VRQQTTALLKELTMISKKNLSILLLTAMSLSSTLMQAPRGAWCCGRRAALDVITSTAAAALTPGGDPVAAALAATEAAVVTTHLNPSMTLEQAAETLAANIRSLVTLSGPDGATMGLDTLAINLTSQMEGAAEYFGLDATSLEAMGEDAASRYGESKKADVSTVLQSIARRLKDASPTLISSLATAIQLPTNTPLVQTLLSFLHELIKGDDHDDDARSVAGSRFTIAARETATKHLLASIEVLLDDADSRRGGASVASSARTNRK
jgi:hypothetical protein